MGAGLCVGGHGVAVDLDVVAGDGGFAGEEGWTGGRCSFDVDDGVIRSVDPELAGKEVRTFAVGVEIDDDAGFAVALD